MPRQSPMFRARPSAASSGRSPLHVRLFARAVELDAPFDQVFREYTRHAMLRRLARSALGPRLTLTGGNALAVHLGEPHRRLHVLDLQVTGEGSLHDVPPALRDLAGDDTARDGLVFGGDTLINRALDRGAAPARQFVMLVKLGTAETAVRVNVEEDAGELEDPQADIPAPFGLGAPATMAVASPAALFADALERILRPDALRVPMRCILDAWRCPEVDSEEDLVEAISEAFSRRDTTIPDDEPYNLSDEFARSAHAQRMWSWMVEREAPGTAGSVEEAVAAVRGVVL